ncbi:tether containing UBX domain for [Nesidiocoris tenuis]|nr:tether containing UBX domain for [Nesidiocoris tenuis]
MESEESNDKGLKRQHRDDQIANPVYLKREINFIVQSPTKEQLPMRYKPEMTVDVLFIHSCKKFGIKPDEHFLILNNRELQRTEILKDLSIVQNSTVKIFRDREPSLEPDIFVSVKIRDCRLGSVFFMDSTLWHILGNLLSSSSVDEYTVPIVSYMAEEFIGEDILKKTRLRDMGVVHGPCLIRFHQVKQEDLDQRKMIEDVDAMTTLESLDFKATTAADAGVKSVHFKIDEDELDMENIHFIGERRALAFRLPDFSTPEEAIHEQYFDLMLEEIQSLFAEISRKSASSKEEIYVEVRKELRKLKNIRTDFDDTMIRVQFPDRTCLQFLFFPEERISDVKTFVRKFLRLPDEDFDLYQIEPMMQLDDHKTIGELKLVPSAKMFFEPKDRRFTSVDQYLVDNITMVPYVIAKEAALMVRGESLDRFVSTEERSSSSRKSTGGFISKFLRSSQSSGKGFGSKTYGSKSYSRFHKKSSFQRWSRGSVGAREKSVEEEEELDAVASGARRKTQYIGGSSQNIKTDE